MALNQSPSHGWRQNVETRRLQLATIEREGSCVSTDHKHRAYARQLQATIRHQRPRGLLMDLVIEHIGPEATVIDIGAGPGRYTIPLARMVREVVAVEPNPIMIGYLKDNLAINGLNNVITVASNWEDAEVPMADFVVCSHVLYDVPNIRHFLRKLDAHARRGSFIVHHRHQFHYLAEALWPVVHGEALAPVPVFDDLLDVLAELGIRDVMEGVMPAFTRVEFTAIDEAIDYGLECLSLADTVANRYLLEPLITDLLETVNGKLCMPVQPPSGVAWWLRS